MIEARKTSRFDLELVKLWFFLSKRLVMLLCDFMCKIIVIVVVCYLFVEFNPEEVGAEGEGFIWRPEADDEMQQTRDVWGKDKE